MHKDKFYEEVNKASDIGISACKYLWNNPEISGSEEESSKYMSKILEENGFRIVWNDKVPHAFYAEHGEGSPVIAVIGEYDALPALSQKVSATQDPVTPGGAGHGCGHNMLGSASLTASIAIAKALDAAGMQGTVRFYGCPEEETLVGKVKMLSCGMFDGCDAAISWHPMSANMVYDSAYLASAAMKFHFKGISAHAAAAPERGRSALDAVELMNVGSNYLREHTVDFSRIHYTTDSYGLPPNLVPDKASAWYVIRAPKMEVVSDILRRIKLVAQGAAMMTETEVSFELLSGCYEILPNHSFADLTYANLQEAELPEFTEEELKFASEIQSTLNPEVCGKDDALFEANGSPMDLGVRPRDLYQSSPLTASSDSGDVSWNMPMNLFTTACWPIGVAPHTWQAAASAGSSIGEKSMLYAARVIAGTACDLYSDSELLAKIKEEFESTGAVYTPMYEE